MKWMLEAMVHVFDAQDDIEHRNVWLREVTGSVTRLMSQWRNAEDLRKRPGSSGQEEKGPEEDLIGLGRYATRMYKELSQPYLDWVMEVEREAPTECSGKMARLAGWSRAQNDLRKVA